MKKALTIFLILLLVFNSNAQDNPDEQYMDAYIVIADTSQNYFELRQQMLALSKKLSAKIDTMGRGFNEEKNLICLPEDDEDEIYAGEYYLRRYPSEALSLEYFTYYSDEETNEKTIALFTIITEDKKEAEKNLIEVSKYSENAFIIKSRLYMGCMH
ncbi:MAG: hypothetical protein COA33_000875 [Fluviicola sp.]|nr:hypothetical protein [Fluviicola sp.]